MNMNQNSTSIAVNSIRDQVFQKAKELGFEWFHVKIQTTRQIGWRMVHNQLSRENIHKEQLTLHFHGILSQRKGFLSLPLFNVAKILLRLEKLRHEILLQAPDEELVIPKVLTQNPEIKWAKSQGNLFDTSLENHIVNGIKERLLNLREEELRLTGFIELAETEILNRYFSRETESFFDLTTHESGGTISVTLDIPMGDQFSKPRPGASATAKKALLDMSPKWLVESILSSIEEARTHLLLPHHPDTTTVLAKNVNHQHRQPVGIEPGRYTVILHPHAVFELLQTMMMYNFFDRRKIDEGRTYLGSPKAIKSFPVGLVLERPFILHTGNKDTPVVLDFPIDSDGQPCNALTFIAGGHLKDTIVSPYWSQKTGLPHTFGPFAGPPLHLDFICPPVGNGEHPSHEMTLAQDLEQLINSTENGLYIAHFWYLRMVSEMDGVLTGMTRDGLFKIENGKITEPLMNMRWHANPFEIISNINGMTKEKRLLGMSRHLGLSRSSLGLVPGIRVKDFPFSSRSTF
jgi:hypothetical protein